jgi:putative ATP-dependent endonuclease of the OLD family
MHISNLKIKNYRNFKNFEIELKPFTLIIGENNIGKTNLLNAIGLVFSQDITFFKKRMLEIDDINYEVKEEFKKSVSEWNGVDALFFPKVEVEINLTGFDENPDQESIVSDWFTDATFKKAKLTYQFDFRGDIKKWAAEHKGKNVKDIDFPIEKCEYSIYGGLDQTKQVDFYFLRMLKMEILDALRDAQKELIANNDSKLLYKILNNRDKNQFSDIKTQLQALDGLVEKHSELESVKDEIQVLLKKLSLEQSENQNKVGFSFSSLEHTEILKKLSLQYGDNPISIERNGLGRNNVLFMSIVLSHLLSDAIKAQNVYFRVVGIEEPEAHLHPHLQEHLAKNIEFQANDKMQIILTSHSTHITSKLDLENTVVLFRNSHNEINSHYILEGFEGVGKNGKISEDAASKKHKRYLSKYLDATKSTLLFGRKMILVEGISEQILIPRFFEIFTKKNDRKTTLESIGCTVVNVNSVAFCHFLELVKNSKTDKENFYIKTLILTDKDTNHVDKDGNPIGRADSLKSIYDDEDTILVQITQTSTFEIDLIEANKSGESKSILLDAIEKTRPNSGKNYKESCQTIDSLFDDIFATT